MRGGGRRGGGGGGGEGRRRRRRRRRRQEEKDKEEEIQHNYIYWVLEVGYLYPKYPIREKVNLFPSASYCSWVSFTHHQEAWACLLTKARGGGGGGEEGGGGDRRGREKIELTINIIVFYFI